MSYETMMYISIGVGVVFLTLSIILFFMFRIPSAISELSGRTARREIQEIMSRESAALPKGRRMKAGARKTEKLKDREVPASKSGTGDSLNERIVRESPVQQNAVRSGAVSNNFPETTVKDVPVRNTPVQEISARSTPARKYSARSTDAHKDLLRSYNPVRISADEMTEAEVYDSNNTALLKENLISGIDTMPLSEQSPGAGLTGKETGDTALLQAGDTGLLTEPPVQRAGDTGLITEPPVPQAGDTGLLTEPPVPQAGDTMLLTEPPVPQAGDTMLLTEPPVPQAGDTMLLTEPPVPQAGDTMLLTEPPVPQAGDTTLLTEPPMQLAKKAEQPMFELESQVMIVHSDEIID